MANSNNRYKFDAVLEGYVRLGEPGGKFNNCSFEFVIPTAVLQQAEEDREELLKWIKTKAKGRFSTALPKWDDDGRVKYTYGPDQSVKDLVVIDTAGQLVPLEVLKSAGKGTKVRLIVQQKPYTFGQALGTTLRVLGMQILELQTFGGAADSGDLSAEDVAALFGPADGFKADSPVVRRAEEAGEDYAADF